MSDIQVLQKRVGKTTKARGHSEDPKIILLFLLEELGEVARAYLKETGHKRENNRVTESFRQEMGDVLYLLLRLAYATDTDLEKEFAGTMRKIEK